MSEVVAIWEAIEETYQGRIMECGATAMINHVTSLISVSCCIL